MMIKSLMLFTLTLLLTTALALLPATAQVIHFPDATLATAIREALQLEEETPITAAALHELTELDASGAGIAALTGLEYATQLTWLNLGSTGVSDVSALANLTQLTRLNLGSTGVSDVSALANLTQLTWLVLGSTSVSDVAALANLTQLTWLNLWNTGVSDVAALANLTQLEVLWLGYTGVSDVAALANLTQLTELNLGSTGVSDVAALANLTQLTELNLGFTGVSDVAALANLTQLEVLYLDGTGVWDVSVLANFTQLTELVLGFTGVSDVSALANLTQLTWLYLGFTGVSDVSALAGLTQLEVLYLWDCPLSYASLNTHIPALQEKGVEVWFDNVAHRALLKVAGTTTLNTLVVEAMDENGQPIVGKTVLFENLQGGGTLSANTVETDARGRAQVTLTLGETTGSNKVKASAEGIQSWVLFHTVATETAPDRVSGLAADVNGDSIVNIQDLVFVSGQFGQMDNNRADVNGDGVVNIQDLVLVAAAFGAEAGAPALAREDIETSARPQSLLRAADVRQWLRDAKAANADPGGIAVLERLLAVLMRIEARPKETVLLANYPNPFNPETWIPYQLAEAAEVEVSIYSADGKLVRMLELGQMPAGTYQRRSRAAYWDGRNAQGEPVASGVYFYTLQAGDFSATRKMVIRK